MKLKIRYSMSFIALIMSVIVLVQDVSAATVKATKIDYNELEAYGFSVNSKVYKRYCELGKFCENVYNDGQLALVITSRMWVCRKKGTYKYAILTWAEIEPRTFYGEDGVTAGISGSVDINVDALVIKNQSSSSSNKVIEPIFNSLRQLG